MAPKGDTATEREPLTREPGKSLLPLARVQKILKADEVCGLLKEHVWFIHRSIVGVTYSG